MNGFKDTNTFKTLLKTLSETANTVKETQNVDHVVHLMRAQSMLLKSQNETVPSSSKPKVK